MKIKFYNVKKRQTIFIDEKECTKVVYARQTSTGLQERFAVRATGSDGASLTKFIDKKTFASLSCPQVKPVKKAKPAKKVKKMKKAAAKKAPAKKVVKKAPAKKAAPKKAAAKKAAPKKAAAKKAAPKKAVVKKAPAKKVAKKKK